MKAKIEKIRVMKTKKEKILYCREWRLLNKESVINKRKEKHKIFPWKRILESIKQRCNNLKNKRYKSYGGRGIKCLITEKELKFLWFRDKAYLLKHPSIDRINNDGNYCIDNCKFIEFSHNSAKDKNKPILQFSLDGTFIKEWDSISDACKYYCTSVSNISCVLRKRSKSAKSFIWKYKE